MPRHKGIPAIIFFIAILVSVCFVSVILTCYATEHATHGLHISYANYFKSKQNHSLSASQTGHSTIIELIVVIACSIYTQWTFMHESTISYVN